MSPLKVFVSYSKKLLVHLSLMILTVTLSIAPLQAQGDASLWGSVTDTSGAGVPDATVTITNLETGVHRALITDESGHSFGVGYIGSHGYHELLSVDTNLPTPTICPASPCPSTYPAGLLYYPANAPLANSALSNTTHWLSEGISSYNGLEVDVNRHFGRGLQFRGVYTFSKALDDGDNVNTSVATNSPAFVANPLDPKADYGRASFDIRHAGVINATYDLPFGRGRTLTEAAGSKAFSATGRSAQSRRCNRACPLLRSCPTTRRTMVTPAIPCGHR